MPKCVQVDCGVEVEKNSNITNGMYFCEKHKFVCPHNIVDGYCDGCKSKIMFGKKVKNSQKTLVDVLNEIAFNER